MSKFSIDVDCGTLHNCPGTTFGSSYPDAQDLGGSQDGAPNTVLPPTFRRGFEMAKRQPVRASLRFRIFERDSFTCQYCGRKPPEVILHLEHVIAIVNGGAHDD